MLYVSRFITENSFGIVDSDDGVETIVTREELQIVCISLHLRVEGVEVAHGRVGWYISSIEPYQDPKTYDSRQLKALMIRGVDVKIYNQEVVSIYLDGSIAKSDVVLRPSEFGKKLSCSARISGSGPFWLTIVLDDKIETVGDAFRVGARGVRFDLREVTNAHTLKCVYQDTIVQYPVSVAEWYNYIIDNDERLLFWKAVASIDDSEEEYITGLISRVDMRSLCKQIEDFYKEDWQKLVIDSTPIAFYSTMRPDDCLKLFVDFMESPWDFSQEVTDFNIVRSRFSDLANMLKLTSTVNTIVIRRLRNYVCLCDVSDDVKKIAIALYNITCKSIVAYCRSNKLSLPG